MDISYLLSITRLYLENEQDKHKTNIGVIKKDENILFNFSINNSDKTSFSMPIEVFNQGFYNFLTIYKKDLIIIDEKYTCDKVDKTCYYYVLYKNGRSISFDGFNILEINNIRNALYGININKEEIRLPKEENTFEIYKPKLQYAGFSSLKNLFFTTLILLDVFVISLWICKMFMN